MKTKKDFLNFAIIIFYFSYAYFMQNNLLSTENLSLISRKYKNDKNIASQVSFILIKLITNYKKLKWRKH